MGGGGGVGRLGTGTRYTEGFILRKSRGISVTRGTALGSRRPQRPIVEYLLGLPRLVPRTVRGVRSTRGTVRRTPRLIGRTNRVTLRLRRIVRRIRRPVLR